MCVRSGITGMLMKESSSFRWILNSLTKGKRPKRLIGGVLKYNLNTLSKDPLINVSLHCKPVKDLRCQPDFTYPFIIFGHFSTLP